MEGRSTSWPQAGYNNSKAGGQGCLDRHPHLQTDDECEGRVPRNLPMEGRNEQQPESDRMLSENHD